MSIGENYFFLTDPNPPFHWRYWIVTVSRNLGLLVLVSFVIYLAYRFWSIGYKLGGPILASSICTGLFVFGGVGLWWAIRQEGPRDHP